jgi:formylglycine-generating enzyme required for sulfatase activity
MDRTPVTNRQFREFINATGYVTFAELTPKAEDYPYSSGVGRLVELQVSGEDLALRLALRSVDASRGPGRG